MDEEEKRNDEEKAGGRRKSCCCCWHTSDLFAGRVTILWSFFFLATLAARHERANYRVYLWAGKHSNRRCGVVWRGHVGY